MMRPWNAAAKAVLALSLMASLVPGDACAQHAAGGAANYRIAGVVVNPVTGTPVPGAAVALLTIADSHRIAATESGSDGRFAMDGLAAAKYQLVASKRGFSTTAYEEHGQFSSAVVTGEGLDTGNLIFKLTPGAVLHGVVTADGGDTVAGAQVMLFSKPTEHEPGAKIVQVDTSITDDTGAYEFGNLEKGAYLLAVRAEPWYAMHSGGAKRNATLDVAYPITYFDSTTEAAAASPIVLTGGSRVEADIGLHAVPALRLVVEAPRKQDGSVARPQLRQTVFGNDIAAVGADFQDSSQTGATEFSGVAPGQYEVTQGDPPRVVALEANASQQLEAGAGVPAFAVNGTLESAMGEPFTGNAAVTLEPADDAQGLKAQVAEFNRGSFSLAALPAGKWVVRVTQLGLVVPVISVTVGGRAQAGNGLTVRDRAVMAVVRVTAGGIRVEGVARREGRGVAGTMVLLVPRDPARFPELVRRDQSDSDGSFAIRDVAPGEYTAVAIENGFADGNSLDWTRPEVIARYLPGGVDVPVTDNRNRVIWLAEPVPVQKR
jgi:hypothetical protein